MHDLLIIKYKDESKKIFVYYPNTIDVIEICHTDQPVAIKVTQKDVLINTKTTTTSFNKTDINEILYDNISKPECFCMKIFYNSEGFLTIH